MKEKFSVKDMLNNRTEQLVGQLELKLNHPVVQGDNSERAWIEFLRSFLPKRYSVDTVFVYDCEGQKSEQIDIAIYDNFYTPLLFEAGTNVKYIAAESVYAIFEVKPKLNKENISYANKKINSVVSMKRESATMVASGKKVDARKPHEILGGILTNESIERSYLFETGYFNEFEKISIVCSAKGTSFKLERSESKGYEIHYSEDGTSVVSFMYMLLEKLNAMGTVPAIKMDEYAKLTGNQLKKI